MLPLTKRERLHAARHDDRLAPLLHWEGGALPEEDDGEMTAVNRVPPPGLSTTMLHSTSIAAPRAGQVIGERYRLEEWLESGGMGSVWRAEQIRLRSPAAIKFLDPSLIAVPEMLERFLQEARSAAAVHCAHVIQIFDFGSEGGLPYIAMELLEGESLASRLAKRGVLSPAELHKVFSELARGIGHAHALGVIHRDLKPGNIFLAREGQHEVTKLIDFGIAKVNEEALRVSGIVGTTLGTVWGTPQYMSPEQLRGWSTLDHRADLWAMAIIACQCLTGCLPFAGSTLGDLTVQICTEAPVAPSLLNEVPRGFDEWFFRGTRKDPNERFASAAEMAEELATVLGVSQRAPVSVRSGAPSVRRLRQAWASTLRNVVTLAGLTLRRAAAGAASTVDGPRRWAQGLTRTSSAKLRRLATQRWSWAAAVALASLVVAGAQVLAPYRRGPAEEPAAAAHPLPTAALQAAAASDGLLPATEPPAGAEPSAVLPVLSAEDLPLAPAAPRAQPPAPSKAAEGRRRGKLTRSDARADKPQTDAPPSSMSDAMARIGALIAEGADARPAAGAGGGPGTARRAAPKAK